MDRFKISLNAEICGIFKPWETSPLVRMAAPPIPPTRQLFVRFPIRLPHEPREVEDIFAKYGQIKHLHLVPKREVAFVTYWKTQDAIEAKKYLDGASPHGIECRVEFNRPTRLLVLDNYPASKSREDIIAILRGELSRFGAIQWIDPMHDKRVTYVMMSSENDAAKIVQDLQGQVSISDWKWEIEFHKVPSRVSKAFFFLFVVVVVYVVVVTKSFRKRRTSRASSH